MVVAVVVPKPISEALHRARLDARISTDELAQRAGVDSDETAAIDAGRPAQVSSPAGLLVDLDRLAEALGLTRGVIDETLGQWANAFTARSRRRRRSLARRAAVESGLRKAVVAAAATLAATAVALGLVHTGSFFSAASPGRPVAAAPRPAGSTKVPGGGLLLSPSGGGSASASYVSPAGALSLSFVASRPTWVEVTSGSGAPLIATTVGPGSTAPITVNVPFTAQIGAGGTVMLVSTGQRQQTLTPPSAPFTFTVAQG